MWLTRDLEDSLELQKDQVKNKRPSGISEGTQQYIVDKEIDSIYQKYLCVEGKPNSEIQTL